jgi:TfoX/Sxy family transcriptional regulator of competence genes
MAFNEKLAERVREIISLKEQDVTEKRMFGGLCFMVNDKMCVGVEAERLMVRFDPAKTDEVMEMEGCMPMDFTGRVMKGYAFVDIAVLQNEKQLSFWVHLALDYNKFAKASKKKQ